MTLAVIAEKPSVARDIAKAVGADRRREGYFEGGGYIVTWAIGHLVALAEPHEIDPAWKAWRTASLPMLPASWPLKVLPATRTQYRVVAAILTDPGVEAVVCATDAGREGELIFRFIYEKAGCVKPVSRLWISSLTPAAIKRGMASLRQASAYDNLAAAARGRSQADWLVGMNLSRAYTLTATETFSVGRVQTPTLAMLVARTRAIQAFVPEDYLVVTASFSIETGGYIGVYVDGEQNSRLPSDRALAEALVERAARGRARVAAIKKEMKRTSPPLLYDLTELQRHANRLFGFSADKTLKTAQSLYEKHKLISYPRTDSRHLSEEVAATLGEVVDAIRGPYEQAMAPGTGSRRLGKRFVNDAKVTDHHAIIPTAMAPRGLAPGSDEARIYDLICRRLLAAWHRDRVAWVTTVSTDITTADETGDICDRYRASGTLVEDEGWQQLDPPRQKKQRPETETYREQLFPPGLAEGDGPAIDSAEIHEKQTTPPKPFTEATLLTAMETAGKSVAEKALSDALRENGLGTPATRAAIIETLLGRGYAERRGKSLFATEKGSQLIDRVHEQVKSPAMTGVWEHRLREIERGKEGLPAFMKDIEAFVEDVIKGILCRQPSRPFPSAGEVRNAQPEVPHRLSSVPPPEESDFYETDDLSQSFGSGGAPCGGWDARRGQTASSRGEPPREPGSNRGGVPGDVGRGRALDAAPPPLRSTADPSVHRIAAQAGESLSDLLRRAFGFAGFRPHQEAVCRAVAGGESVLLVMPTGAGKSLCYQLPGVARGGTTLVVSPLIALMEDQTAQLREKGFAAERIHSGMSREAARQVCRRYLQGDLDFFFIAPERLGVSGFPEMLTRRMPVLVAVDEAHCISHWGHDFRPDYRMLKERLAPLRSAPIIAMTATATPIVQDDIVHQLDMPDARRFIHGFRRTNIAVEVVEMPQRARAGATASLLTAPGRRPAIVYAPTRKKAESLAAELTAAFPAAAYHAGMNPAHREQVQRAFLTGRLDVIVATIAFGMGIDKPDVRTVVHVALPGSMEGYYQEIGRAGRDGQPSRAVLMYAYADVKTHEFFLGRDYPEPATMARVHGALTSEKQHQASLVSRIGLDEETVGTVLEKLWIHGGAEITPDERVARGTRAWRAPYEAQRQHRIAQLDLMVAYAQSKECRMLRLVNHFGDQEDSGAPCGHCDFCAPSRAGVQATRAASREEQQQMLALLEALSLSTAVPKGRLFRDRFEETLSRNEFEALVDGLFRAGLLGISQESFEKNGRRVEFQRLHITANGHRRLREAKPVDDAIRMVVVAPSGKPPRGSKKKTAGPKRESAPPAHPPSHRLVAELKAWRLELARKRGIPAFRILTDRVVNGIAAARPQTADDLLQVSGIGDTIMKKYGVQIIAICRRLAD